MDFHKLEIKSRISFKKLKSAMSPSQIVMLSFFSIILIGAALLKLPFSQTEAAGTIPFLDCLFTATSAVCVTGLVTFTTATSWTAFGKVVILLLIQIGGLGLVAIITYFGVYLGKKITLKERITIQTAFNHTDFHGMVRMVMFVIKGTLICEGAGAIILFIGFLREGLGASTALIYSVFHAISAFCNAGFDIIGQESLMPFASNPFINTAVTLLIIIGGIGFSVWVDFKRNIKKLLSPKITEKGRFSLHSKLALSTTLLLLLLGTLYFFIAEYDNQQLWGNVGIGGKLLRSYFQSVTLRTAGFFTVNQGALSEMSKFVSAVFMIIGGSTGGTAGGIKTVTIAVVICSVWSIIKGRYTIDVFNRNIQLQFLQKSLTIITIMTALLCSGTAFLSFTEQSSAFPHSMVDLFYEVSSALGTVGLTTGITPYLSPYGKGLIILCMFIGRIGPISIIMSLTKKREQSGDIIRYPKEDILIG